MKRKMSAVLAVLTAAMLLTGCGNTGTPETTAAAAVTQFPAETTESAAPESTTVPETVEPQSGIPVRPGSEKLSFRFPISGPERKLAGKPEVRPIPGEYRDLARGYFEGVDLETAGGQVSKLLTCDLDGNGVQELILVYPIESEGLEHMACSVFTLKDGYPTALVEDYWICSMSGDCNGRICILEKNGGIYLALENYGEPVGYRTGDLSIYCIIGDLIDEIFKISYEWYGEPYTGGVFRTLYDQCTASINGEACSFQEFEDLWGQMNILYQDPVFSYDYHIPASGWGDFTGYENVTWIPIDW